MPCSQQHAAPGFFWPLVSLLPTMGRDWCWDATKHRSLSTLALLSAPSVRLIQHESMWVWTFNLFSPLLKSSTSLHLCAICLQFSPICFHVTIQAATFEAWNFKCKRRNGRLLSVDDFLLLTFISRLAGHHFGTVDPLCCVVSSWGGSVCLVLHRWIGPKRAGSLWEQLHQWAGVCVCVFVWGLEGTLESVHLKLSDSELHTWS